MKIAVIGATGLVGRELLSLIEQQEKNGAPLLAASDLSRGKKLLFSNKKIELISIEDVLNEKPDVAIFSCGDVLSLEWAPKFAQNGIYVIDNSVAWRMHPSHKLIVPEINANTLTKNDKIIANPNCSTIQMVMALYPLHKIFTINRIVVSTYQSVTGSGKEAVNQLLNERNNNYDTRVYPHPIDFNALPHVDDFLENRYTKEEMKMVNETRKILQNESLAITTTAVRLPILGGHGMSINVSFKNDITLNEIFNILIHAEGVTVQDNLSTNLYPMPINAKGKDDVFVGRIRLDESLPNTINMWVVSDNLRKGAATNAYQIMNYLIDNNYLEK